MASNSLKPNRLAAIFANNIAVVMTILALAACSNTSATPPVGLEPTRTPAPKSDNVAPEQTAAPKSRLLESTAIATDAPVVLPTIKLDACADTTLDLAATVPAARRTAGQIVYLDKDGNIVLTDASGRRSNQVTTDAFVAEDQGQARIYQFPTFSNDGKSLAFVSLNVTDKGSSMTQTLHVANARANASLTDLYSTRDDNIPYLDWSPDGASVAFLTIGQGRGEIRVAPSKGGDVTVLDTGSSAYWHWRSDSNAIVAHLGGVNDHISLIDPAARGSKSAASPIKSVPGRFQSPHYSPNGKFMIYAIDNGDAIKLVLADTEGAPICSISTVAAGAYFAWSPSGQQVAIMDTISPLQQPQPLSIIDLPSGKRTTVNRQGVAFFWSPDGSKIALYSLVADTPATKLGLGPARNYSSAQQNDNNLALRIEMIDAATGTATEVADTLPSRQFAQFFQFFDQYSRAVTPWSPDSKNLVFVSFNRETQSTEVGVATLARVGNAVSLKRIASGTLAFWSPN